MPSVLPASSGHGGGGGTPIAHWLSQVPRRRAASRRAKSRVSARIAPSTYSAMPTSWPYAFASHAPRGSADRSIRSRPAPGTCTSLSRRTAPPISRVNPSVTSTSTSASRETIPFSSSTRTSHGVPRRALTGSARHAAKVPAKATRSMSPSVPRTGRRLATRFRRFLPRRRSRLRDRARRVKIGATMRKRIVFLVVPPVDELDLVGPLEVFGAANRLLGGGRAPYAVEIVTTAQNRQVDGVGGLSLLAHQYYQDCAGRADSVLVICGVATRTMRDRALFGWLGRD